MFRGIGGRFLFQFPDLSFHVFHFFCRLNFTVIHITDAVIVPAPVSLIQIVDLFHGIVVSIHRFSIKQNQFKVHRFLDAPFPIKAILYFVHHFTCLRVQCKIKYSFCPTHLFVLLVYYFLISLFYRGKMY